VFATCDTPFFNNYDAILFRAAGLLIGALYHEPTKADARSEFSGSLRAILPDWFVRTFVSGI
jgi:hypothetical protein